MKQMAFALALFCLLTLLVPAAGYLAGGYLKLPTQPLALAQPDNPSDPQQEDLQQTETAQSSPAPAGQTGMIVVQDASTGQVLEIPVLEYMIGAVASECPLTGRTKPSRPRPLRPTAMRCTSVTMPIPPPWGVPGFRWSLPDGWAT